MKRLRRQLLLLGLLGAGVYFSYQNLLSDEAKEQLCAAFATIKDTAQRMQEQLGVPVEFGMSVGATDKAQDLPNRQETMKQWEALGL